MAGKIEIALVFCLSAALVVLGPRAENIIADLTGQGGEE